jgi:hypothetical protein
MEIPVAGMVDEPIAKHLPILQQMLEMISVISMNASVV